VIKENLDKIVNTPLDFKNHLSFTLQCNHAEYKLSVMLEDLSKPNTLEAIWGSNLVFSYIGLKDLIYLFSALMLEKKLVFLSKNIHQLTATM